MKKIISAIMLLALLLFVNVNIDAKTKQETVQIKKINQIKKSKQVKKNNTIKTRNITKKVLINETATTRVYKEVETESDSDGTYTETVYSTFKKISSNKWALVETRTEYEELIYAGNKIIKVNDIGKYSINIDEDACEINDDNSSEYMCYGDMIEWELHELSGTGLNIYSFGYKFLDNGDEIWFNKSYHSNGKISNYTYILCRIVDLDEEELIDFYDIKSAFEKNYNNLGLLTSHKEYGYQEMIYDNEGDIKLSNPTYFETRTYHSNKKLKDIKVSKAKTNGAKLSDVYKKSYNSDGNLTSLFEYRGKSNYSETRTYHSNKKLKNLTIRNYTTAGAQTSGQVKEFDSKGRQIQSRNFDKSNKNTSLVTKQYYNNNVAKYYTKYYYEKPGKVKKIAKYTYRSNKSKAMYTYTNYSNGKIAKKVTFTYNKKGQLKSNKYGNAYRQVINYSKVGKTTSNVKQKYNAKGKLIKK